MGRSEWLRGQLRGEELLYMADIPRTTQVYLTKPEVRVPEKESGQRGREATKVKVLSSERPQMVFSLAQANDTQWQELRIRTTERGELRACQEITVTFCRSLVEWKDAAESAGKRFDLIGWALDERLICNSYFLTGP